MLIEPLVSVRSHSHQVCEKNRFGDVNDGGRAEDGAIGFVNRRFPLLTERSVCTILSVTEESPLSKPSDLVQGTLDLLLLKILALQPMNGWAISLRLKSISGDVLQVSEGSLYPALHKLEQEGWITAEWKQTENNRRAKFYSLTRLGRKQLESEAANWQRLSSAISHVVRLEEA